MHTHVQTQTQIGCNGMQQFQITSDSVYTADTSYLCGSEVFRSFPVQVSVKVTEDICSASATAPLPQTIGVDFTEDFETNLCTYICTYYAILRIDRDFRLLRLQMMLENPFRFWRVKRPRLSKCILINLGLGCLR